MIQNFLAILIKFGSTFLFVFMQLFCFYLIINYNTRQMEIWANSSNLFTGTLYEKYSDLTSFINLKDQNQTLAVENARLMRELASINFKKDGVDSLLANNFNFIPALVINNSISKLNNRITLNVGSDEGVTKGMGVITQDGIVGVVVYASKHYSTVNSLLNIQTKVSALIKRTNTIGDLTWKGKNPDFLSMNSVPQYVPLMIGDTIVSSGYSTMFPKGLTIGEIINFKENRSKGYFDINVKLNVDLASISQVYIIKNMIFDEIKEFENEAGNE